MNGFQVVLDKQEEIMLLKGKGFFLNHLLDYWKVEKLCEIFF